MSRNGCGCGWRRAYAKKPPPLGVTIGEKGNTVRLQSACTEGGYEDRQTVQGKDRVAEVRRHQFEEKQRSDRQRTLAKWEAKKKGSRATFWRAVKDLKTAKF